MFLGLCTVVMLAAVPLTGGSLARLAALPVRGVRLLVSALGLQVLVISVWPSMPHPLAVAGHVTSYAVLVWVLWLNRCLPGMVLIGAGAGANAVTIALNGGTLPASASALRAAGIHLRPGFDNSGIVGHPRLAWLGDIMATPSWLPMRNMLSVGDLLLLAGAAVLVIASTRRATGPLRHRDGGAGADLADSITRLDPDTGGHGPTPRPGHTAGRPSPAPVVGQASGCPSADGPPAPRPRPPLLR